MKLKKWNLWAVLVIVPICLVCNGCASPAPSDFEQYIFNVETNSVPVATNWTSTETITNAAGGVEVRNVVNWATNIQTHFTYTASTNAAALTQSAANVANVLRPGLGDLVGGILIGILGAWAKLRSTINRGKAANVVMSQGIETLLAIVETTPQGKVIADRMKLQLVKNQKAAGVLAEIARIVETHVDNEAAKKTARAILATMPSETAQPALL
jgi:hypothetical protein